MINANTPFSHINDRDSCLYFLVEDSSRLKDGVSPRCKIGITDRLDCTLRQFRMQILRASSAEDFEIFHAIKTPSKEIASSVERHLHSRFANNAAVTQGSGLICPPVTLNGVGRSTMTIWR